MAWSLSACGKRNEVGKRVGWDQRVLEAGGRRLGVRTRKMRFDLSTLTCWRKVLRVEESRESDAEYSDSSWVVRGEGRWEYRGWTVHVRRCVTWEPDIMGVVIDTVGCRKSGMGVSDERKRC